MDGSLYTPDADCVASLQRATGELTAAARHKGAFPASFLSATDTDIAIRHLRAAARSAPRPHRMRIARLAASLRMTMRYSGRAPHDAVLALAAEDAGEIAEAIEHSERRRVAA